MVISMPKADVQSPAEAWLARFPVPQHATVEAWFRHVIRQGAQSPDQVLVKLTVLLGQKLAWSAEPASRQLCTNALEALRCNRPGALAFAASLLATYAQRVR